MVTLEEVSGSLLQKPSDTPLSMPPRDESSYKPLATFALDKQRSYKQQYGDMYFLRLTKIKPVVEQVAAAAWAGTTIGGETAGKVDRVLDVRQGELCWVAGTVYMDMALKPNILEDVSKDRWLSAPISTQKYYSDDGTDQVTLEDDSGRVRLVGDVLKTVPLVTGCIIAVMGTENTSGEFEVLDLKFPDLPPQPARWALGTADGTHKQQDTEMTDSGGGSDAPSTNHKQIAIVSGLSFSGADASCAVEVDLLLEYLLGESLSPDAQSQASRISRFIIAGDSISAAAAAAPDDDNDDTKAAAAAGPSSSKKYGYDASTYNALPSQLFDEFVSALLPSLPVTLLPGARDPANASYPQQPLHTALFPSARAFGADPSAGAAAAPGWFDSVTNPWEAEVEGWRVLGTGGQNVDDVFKYVDSDDRLGMMEAMCRWRCCAPTAPDTLWSYPFQDDDPFVLNACPHLYFVGNQPAFGTRLIHGPDGQSVRLVAVPSFAVSKEIVLVDMETLDVTKVKIETS
ncbi:DNA polymerase delta subunit 2 [Cordyceps militaris CM01]|uniref:DNA-directed DNA polymerase n=1 Tax=Cordyceps militaris (strain CM01) TaxID=983644 RepID=G3J4S1_CORMM|nr:DNA polymerase delta subunit 2 [Cordyceps militaris CM01]EGX96736.1 DNA polymerase delta subunit 2 [Cordyceps militaris CM01]